MKPTDGRIRVVIEAVSPQLDCGRYPVRRVVGEVISVTAAIFADGHDRLGARLLYRHSAQRSWRFEPMLELDNDQWTGTFTVDKLGLWQFYIVAWVDPFRTWCVDLRKRLAVVGDADANVSARDIRRALDEGELLVQAAAVRAFGADARRLRELSRSLAEFPPAASHPSEFPLSAEDELLIAHYPDRAHATRLDRALAVRVERERAQFSAWYELFPRSTSPVANAHGTLADVARQLPDIAAMGFDILYLPPIHPIGRKFRRGANNTSSASPGDPGSPWAIGDASVQSALIAANGGSETDEENAGGHKSIHPQLGTFADFNHLVATAKSVGMEIALDIAFQCSPDHPWVAKHPDWFRIRVDGSIQFAENPPKAYRDIYPLNFESRRWRQLWDELYSVFEFWIRRGVHVFRVDNPHTKALPFWEWCVGQLMERHPDTILLAEAFTRPHAMYALAKIGFSQSYTYFTWRNSKAEIESYLKELTRPPLSEFFRPNFWPNTPDILPRALQQDGRPAFEQRIILAATLAANYGIYGPAYELCESAAAAPSAGRDESEEYEHSEKYEIRQRARNATSAIATSDNAPNSIASLIRLLNEIRRANPALRCNESLTFHEIDNEHLLCYSKSTRDLANTILVVVNLDPCHEQMGRTTLRLEHLGVSPDQSFAVEDLLTGARYVWQGPYNSIVLNPQVQIAHIFRIDRNTPS